METKGEKTDKKQPIAAVFLRIDIDKPLFFAVK